MMGREAVLTVLDHASLAVLRHGPARLAHALPALLARRLGPRLYAGPIARIRANLAQLRPDLPAEAAEEAMEHLARTLCEGAVFPRLAEEGRVEVEGAEHLGPGPVLLASVHLGCWPLAALMARRLGRPLAGPHQPPPNRRRAAALARAFRDADVGLLTEDAGRRGPLLARRLRKGSSVIMYVDAEAVAPALGRAPRAGGNLEATVRLARLSGLDPVPVHCERLPGGWRHRVTFHPPLRLPRAREEAVAALDAALEPLVRQHLTQWLFLPEFRPDG